MWISSVLEKYKEGKSGKEKGVVRDMKETG
jgi:hypothetical protein